MTRLLLAALDVQTFCESRGWRFCIIGGVAVQRWGEPRVTRDVDLSLLTGLGGEEQFIDPLLVRDVEGIIVRQGASLDRALVLEELHPLLDLKEDEDAAGRLEMLFSKHPA